MISPTLKNSRAKERGKRGEDAAAEYIKSKGMRILARNWRKRQLEIDIICKDKDTIVFVEVKTRASTGLTTPAEALSLRKCNAMIRAARFWLAENNAWHCPCRFDLIAVFDNGHHLHLEHTPHVLELSTTVGYSHATWQPW